MSSIPLSADAKAILRQRQQELDRQVQQLHEGIRYLQNEAAERNGDTIGSHLDADAGLTSALSGQSLSKAFSGVNQ
ncbi:hypothetical protein GYMLUDRAFT_42268 [Collybiopsis luxurians FD-317 M1]|uniref:Uncharacterized protein n=1 Tax=Collybiopsis luxurians FD-317 M1 TaxID=944289 RepID=A0A0D0CZ98_9AGAR|nr:hypothetical protein GYMLUDRAFT_42268 [Collybiopsis luxurians FD-317 M1]